MILQRPVFSYEDLVGDLNYDIRLPNQDIYIYILQYILGFGLHIICIYISIGGLILMNISLNVEPYPL